MAIVQCSRLHYYDNEKFKECPHCAKLATGKMEQDSATVAMALESQQVENYAVEYLKKNASNTHINVTADRDSERTVSIYEKRGVAKCIAGWLVCVKGEEYGKDFPLYAGFNRIGRSHSNDIVLKDVQVSREEHCSVIYEEKKNVFYISPNAGNLSYVEEEMIDRAQELKSGQVITVGETQLELVAFCIGEKKWKKRENIG